MKILGYHYELKHGPPADEMSNWGLCLHRLKKLLIAEAMEALKYHLQLSIAHDDLMALEAGLFTVLTENGVDLSPLREELE